MNFYHDLRSHIRYVALYLFVDFTVYKHQSIGVHMKNKVGKKEAGKEGKEVLGARCITATPFRVHAVTFQHKVSIQTTKFRFIHTVL